MKKSKTPSFLYEAQTNRVDALIGASEPTPAELSAELAAFGLHPEDLQRALFQRVRAVATERYTSMGRALPTLMSEALKQTRPRSPDEERAYQAGSATSRVQGILGLIQNAGRQFSQPLTFAPAFRNKDDAAGDDEDLLRAQQQELDEEQD